MKGGEKGLSDSTGRNVLPIKYDAIGDWFDDNVSILKGKKFGLFNYSTRKTIQPTYYRPIKPYNKQFFIAFKEGKYGLVNILDKTVLPFEFDEIKYWTDFLVLARLEDEWQLIQMDSGEPVVEGIREVELIKDEDEEKIMVYKVDKGYGVLSNKRDEIIGAGFDRISYRESSEQTLYVAEKEIPEADYYVLIYFDEEGEYIHRQALSKEEYQILSCPE